MVAGLRSIAKAMGLPPALIARIFRDPESPIAGSARSGLSSLSSLSSHISTAGPKTGEHLKENAALPMSPKAQKGSNFIEFYKNHRHTENLKGALDIPVFNSVPLSLLPLSLLVRDKGTATYG
jgi:hypothetical protein